ncbi:hypothetical protein AGOR_G00119060 [Albula goreensis]|uniref:Uncharacterized protein n=1 Tax=Albula goreensis TaxID=1534307 RepID=A0A8T3DF54_9TELE|nr:hypothetical protein AGOR_G00119060 [Albula goreensis]
MLSDRYNTKNHNVTWDVGSIGPFEHNHLTVVGKAGQCQTTNGGVSRNQTRLTVCDLRVDSRPCVTTKVPKSKKCNYDKPTQNAEYLKEIETQRKLQCQSKAFLEETERSVPEKLQMPHECAANYERTIRELKLQHNQTLANLKTEMESERILLEEKIGKLKLNVSDVLLEKSRERQKQLQELHKENATLKAEIAALQSQLQIQKTPEMCVNCQSLEMAVEEKALQLIQKEKMVEELQRFCRKFCKQLTQQDRLLAMMSDLHNAK